MRDPIPPQDLEQGKHAQAKQAEDDLPSDPNLYASHRGLQQLRDLLIRIHDEALQCSLCLTTTPAAAVISAELNTQQHDDLPQHDLDKQAAAAAADASGVRRSCRPRHHQSGGSIALPPIPSPGVCRSRPELGHAGTSKRCCCEPHIFVFVLEQPDGGHVGKTDLRSKKLYTSRVTHDVVSERHYIGIKSSSGNQKGCFQVGLGYSTIPHTRT